MLDQDTANYLKKNIDKVESLEKYKTDSFVSWIRHIITILVGLLTVLVAFGKNNIDNCFILYLFSSILISIAISVITGTIFLFHQISEMKQTIKSERQMLNIRLSGDIYSILKGDVIKIKLIFKICEYMFYTFSILTIIQLVLYGIMINK